MCQYIRCVPWPDWYPRKIRPPLNILEPRVQRNAASAQRTNATPRNDPSINYIVSQTNWLIRSRKRYTLYKLRGMERKVHILHPRITRSEALVFDLRQRSYISSLLCIICISNISNCAYYVYGLAATLARTEFV